MSIPAFWMWSGFAVFVLSLLALDLLVFNRKSHEVKIKEALLWSVIWVIIALLFNAGVFFFGGKEKGVNFLTGYLIERALSMDKYSCSCSYFSISGSREDTSTRSCSGGYWGRW